MRSGNRSAATGGKAIAIGRTGPGCVAQVTPSRAKFDQMAKKCYFEKCAPTPEANAGNLEIPRLLSVH